MKERNRNVGLRVIASEADVRAGIRALRRRCEAARRMHDAVGDPPLRRMAPDFAGLARIVTGQQLSIASAAAIWRRVEALGPVRADAFLRHSDIDLRGAGLSAGKIKTLRAVSAAVAHEGLDFDVLCAGGDDAVRARLTQIHGVGPWTADIFVMFGIGRADAFAPGDLALQVAAGRVLGLEAKPAAAELEAIADRWRPWRGVAARLLWAYYAHKGNGAAPVTPV
jgi:DNA-3-methyladenine glycosylase II